MSINPYKNRLFARLDEIASNLKKDRHVLALLTLGSVGLETNRIDQRWHIFHKFHLDKRSLNPSRVFQESINNRGKETIGVK